MRKFLALALLLLASPAAQAVTFHELSAASTSTACEIPVWQGGAGGEAYKLTCTAFFAGLPGLSSDSAFRTAIGAVTGPGSSANGNIATFSGTGGKTIQDGGKALPAGSVVGTTDTQTLTNKTLTSPTINGGAILPSQTAGIVGTTTNNDAAAGAWGEYSVTTVAVGSAVSITSGGSAINVGSKSYTAGDYDCTAVAVPTGSATSITLIFASLVTSSATDGALGTMGAAAYGATFSLAGFPPTLFIGPVRISLATTTTLYLTGKGSFSGGTVSLYGQIRCRRVR